MGILRGMSGREETAVVPVQWRAHTLTSLRFIHSSHVRKSFFILEEGNTGRESAFSEVVSCASTVVLANTRVDSTRVTL